MYADVPAVSHMSAHVLSHLARHRSTSSNTVATPPLFVGVQGPQGSGKTYLTSKLCTVLTTEPHNLSVTVLSIDDLYLTQAALVNIAETYAGNRLLEGRGLPGTHDVDLGREVLYALKHINEHGAPSVILPIFDKSLHNGRGDRIQEGVVVKGPVDVVILEGWCVGFCFIDADEIESRWSRMDDKLKQWCSQEHVRVVNEKLTGYAKLWETLDVFMQVRRLIR